MNDELRKKAIYAQPTWRNVQAWYDIRSDAVHANYGNDTDQQVELMIAGVRDFIGQHPA